MQLPMGECVVKVVEKSQVGNSSNARGILSITPPTDTDYYWILTAVTGFATSAHSTIVPVIRGATEISNGAGSTLAMNVLLTTYDTSTTVSKIPSETLTAGWARFIGIKKSSVDLSAV